MAVKAGSCRVLFTPYDHFIKSIKGTVLEQRNTRCWVILDKPYNGKHQHLIDISRLRPIPPNTVKYFASPIPNKKGTKLISYWVGEREIDGVTYQVWNPVGNTMSVWYRLEAEGKRTKFIYAPQGMYL